MDPNEAGVPTPTIGRIVIYRSRTGDYDVPAIINATAETLNRKGVEAGYIPDLSAHGNVHLTVFSPGVPGAVPMGHEAPRFTVESTARIHGEPLPISQNQGGTYQEWDIPLNDPATGEIAPGTWRWPVRA